jgi:methoxymalonate biosynthesis acyl carrier protein
MESHVKIRSFIQANLLVFEDEVSFVDSDNIFQMGYVNSLFAMKLLNYVESEFSIKVDNDEMDIRNFSSVDSIVALISRKTT